jgi:hypothetical protein
VIIALGHRSRVGKDTAAKMLVQVLRLSGKHREVRKASFAKVLKDAAHLIRGHSGLQPGDFYEDHPERRKDVIIHGAEGPIDVVDYWIKLGQAVRSFDPAAWCDAVLALRPKDGVLVISDLRFPNEGDAIHALGGLCIRVDNPRVTQLRGSDVFLEDWTKYDEILVNDRDLNAFQATVENFARTRGLI